MDQYHCVLDMDGTLVNSRGSPRPGLDDFLDFCFKSFASVSIWTAAGREWYNSVANVHWPDRPFKFVWTGERCSRKIMNRDSFYPDYVKIKRLTKVFRRSTDFGLRWTANPFTRHNTFIIDDTPMTYRENYGNGVRISTWENGPDTEFEKIQAWAARSLTGESIRHIGKRY